MSLNPINELSTSETHVKKFRLYGLKTIFKFTNPPTGTNEFDWLRQGFAQIVNQTKARADENDMIGFTLHSINLKSKEPGYVAFQKASEINEDILWEIFGGIVQSHFFC